MSTANLGYDSVVNSNALTITLASLATSATWVTGRNSTLVDNTSTKYRDFTVTGQITTGTSPTAGTILVFIYPVLKVVSSTFTLPMAEGAAISASDAAETFDSEQLKRSLTLAYSIPTNATSDRSYGFSFSVARVLGLYGPPLGWGMFLAHNTGVNLNATAGNHWVHWTGLTDTIA